MYPTPALAQEAEMSLSDYEDFVYGACRLDTPDPVAAWREQSARPAAHRGLAGGQRTDAYRGPRHRPDAVHRRAHIPERRGPRNFPDGEVFTSPVEDVTAAVAISYPAVFKGAR